MSISRLHEVVEKVFYVAHFELLLSIKIYLYL